MLGSLVRVLVVRTVGSDTVHAWLLQAESGVIDVAGAHVAYSVVGSG